MKLLSKVLLAIALAAAGTGIIASCNEKPITPPAPQPEQPNPDKPNPDKPNPDKANPDKPNPDKPNPDKPNPEPQPQPNPNPQPQPNPDPQPEPQPEPNTLQEAKVVYLGKGNWNGILFQFEGIDNVPNLGKNKLKKEIRNYYKSQLLVNGQEGFVFDTKFGLSIEDNVIGLHNLPTEYNTEITLKKGTILKAAKGNEIVELAISSNELKLRYNGTEYVQSDTPLPPVDDNPIVEPKEVTGIEVDAENKELTHDLAEGVDFVVTLTPEGSKGEITAQLEKEDDEVEVKVEGLTVNVFTVKMPDEETVVKVIIKVVGTDLRKVVTVTIPKYESPKQTQNVVLHLNGGNMTFETVQVVKGEKLVISETPTKDGHRFVGWYTDQELNTPYDFEAVVNTDLDLYAKWEEEVTPPVVENVTLTLDLQGGQLEGELTFTVEKGQEVSKPTNNPTKEGYTFEKWVTEVDGDEEYTFGALTENKTVYAKWIKNPVVDPTEEDVTLTLDLQEGQMTGSTTITVKKGQSVTKPEEVPTREGFTFEKWVTEANGDVEYEFGVLNANTTIYAKWVQKAEEPKEKVTLILDLQGGTTTGQTSFEVEKGQTVEKPAETPTKEGHTFDKWVTTQGGDEEYTFGELLTSTTIYAKWIEDTFTVTFNTDGGLSTSTEVKVQNGQMVQRPENNPTKEGHTFVNWYKDEAKETEFNFESETITQDTVIYAKWQIQEFTVTFQVEEGVNMTGEKQVKVNWDQTVAKPENPTKDGFTFVNWYSDSQLQNEFDFNTKIKENTTLYPKFERIIEEKVATNESANDQHSPLVLGFNGLTVTRDSSKENIEDEIVLNAIKEKITGKTLDYIKYEDNQLKVYFGDTNKVVNGEQVTVASGLKLYQFIDGAYVQVGVTTNELKLVAIDGKFKNLQEGEKTFTLEYKVKENTKKFGYKAENATVESFELQGSSLKVTYKYNQENESTLSLFQLENEVADNLVTDESQATKLHDYKISLYDAQKNDEQTSKYTEQGMEDIVNVLYEEGNILVVFASNILGEELPKLHHWGFENSPQWDSKPEMQKVAGQTKVYSYLIKLNKNADELGFIVTKADGNTKLTSDVKSTNETIKSHFEQQGGLKVLYIYSDQANAQNNDNVVLGTSMNFDSFKEKLDALK